MSYMLVGLGGAAGALTRYMMGRLMAKRCGTTFPFGTLLINVTGAILLGVVCGVKMSSNAMLLISEGFLGAYTTYSTFMVESLGLLKGQRRLGALLYIGLSALLGFLGFAGAYYLAAR